MNNVWTKKVTLDLDKIGGSWWSIGFKNDGGIVLISYDFEQRGFLSYDHDKEDDSSDLWSFGDFEDPEKPFLDYGYEGPFAYRAGRCYVCRFFRGEFGFARPY